MIFALIWLAISLTSLAALWLVAARAPLGWQDDTGFHHGEPDLGSFHGQGF